MRNGVQGTVLLVKSSGSRELDQAALKHVLAAQRFFHPAQCNDHAIEAWAQVPVAYKLSGA